MEEILQLPKIKEYDQAMDLIRNIREEVESGNVMSVMVVAEMADGNMYMGSTATQDVYKMFGYLLACSMARMGFSQSKDMLVYGEEGGHEVG